MQQKFQGTHRQQPDRKRHCKENKQGTLKPGKCSPCSGNSRHSCCNHVTTTSTFKNQQIQKSYKLFR